MYSDVVWFFNAAGFFFELTVSMAMFTWWVKRREHFAMRLIGYLCAAVIFSLIWQVFVPYVVWSIILRCFAFYGLCLLGLRFCLNLNWDQSLFYAVAAIALQHTVFCASRMIAMQFTKPNGTFNPDILNIAYPIAEIPVGILAYILFAKPLKERLPYVTGSRFLMLTVGILLSVNVFSCLFDWYMADITFPDAAYALFMMLRIVVCMFLLLMLREIVDRENAEHNGEVLQQLLYQQKSQLESDKETIDLINVKTHDLKKQLSMLGGRISQEEIDGLKQLVDIYDSSVHTGNETLDVLLANKSLLCEQKGIQFDRMIDGSQLSFMKPSDIYAMFGNALDNAIEATLKIEDPAQRLIRMKVRTSRGMLVIHMSNPFAGELRFHEGLPQTTKDDRRYHGFGTRSIRMITEQYGGVMDIHTDERNFVLDILIPLPNVGAGKDRPRPA